MAKKKTTKKIRVNKEYESVLSSDEERFDEPSNKRGAEQNYPSDSDDLMSEEDDQNISSSALKKDKLLLDKYDDEYEDQMTENEEEVMAFSSDDSDESEDQLTSYYTMKAKKDEMESDLEDEIEDNIPSAEAWGKKKGMYYNTDFVDKDFRKFTQEDEELALAEEEEALQAQKRLLDEINDADVGFELYEKLADKVDEAEDVEQKKLEVDLSSLKSHEKRKLLQRTSPEIVPLISDFNRHLENVRDTIEPILKLAEKPEYKIIKKSSGYKFLELKYSLAMRYALNISFYMALKCNQVDTKNHPITKTLFTYNKLLTELEKSEKSTQIMSEIKEIVNRLKKDEKLSFIVEEEPKKKPQAFDVATIMKKVQAEDSQAKVSKKKVKFMDSEEEGEEEDIEVDEDDDEEEDDELNILENFGKENSDVDEEGEEESSKRAITYQIAKNKGLTAKKKKELRNPRVKHRQKFKKATARRKGQVRPPRKELKKYSGEISGIRSSVVKSVKFK